MVPLSAASYAPRWTPSILVRKNGLGYHRIRIMRPTQALLYASLLFSPGAFAFESDVHYGLTEWLARGAGFDEREARTIATGNQRVDSGDMQYIDDVFMYACVGKDDVGVKRAGVHHYPTVGPVPGALGLRVVSPGGDAAKGAAISINRTPPEKAGFMLLRLGEALHVLQDSWSHQGVPEAPTIGMLQCDSTRSWGHPKARGGAHSHRADLTMHWRADVVAMAQATYEVLTQFPGTRQNSRSWEEIRPLLDGFIKASTKSRKQSWFSAQGISDVSFLEGISLPDGTRAFDLKWPGRRLPPIPTYQVRQHDVDADLLEFYHQFFARWTATRDFEKLASRFGAGDKAELAARLKLWRLRDHGRVADMAHSARSLTEAQRSSLDAIGKERNAYAAYQSQLDAYFPLLPRTEGVSPLLPFFVATNPGKAVAVVKFRHAPYDTVAVVAENRNARWRVTSIVSTVDH